MSDETGRNSGFTGWALVYSALAGWNFGNSIHYVANGNPWWALAYLIFAFAVGLYASTKRAPALPPAATDLCRAAGPALRARRGRIVSDVTADEIDAADAAVAGNRLTFNEWHRALLAAKRAAPKIQHVHDPIICGGCHELLTRTSPVLPEGDAS